MIQGIAAGVGFLGGGEIWRESSQPSKTREIYGLTSAAVFHNLILIRTTLNI